METTQTEDKSSGFTTLLTAINKKIDFVVNKSNWNDVSSTVIRRSGDELANTVLETLIWNDFEPSYTIQKMKLQSIDEVRQFYLSRGGDCTAFVDVFNFILAERGCRSKIVKCFVPTKKVAANKKSSEDKPAKQKEPAKKTAKDVKTNEEKKLGELRERENNVKEREDKVKEREDKVKEQEDKLKEKEENFFKAMEPPQFEEVEEHVAVFLKHKDNTSTFKTHLDSCQIFWDVGLHHPHSQILYDSKQESRVYTSKNFFVANCEMTDLIVRKRPSKNADNFETSTYALDDPLGNDDLFALMKKGKPKCTGKIMTPDGGIISFEDGIITGLFIPELGSYLPPEITDKEAAEKLNVVFPNTDYLWELLQYFKSLKTQSCNNGSDNVATNTE